MEGSIDIETFVIDAENKWKENASKIKTRDVRIDGRMVR
jgi:hypothetical protein